MGGRTKQAYNTGMRCFKTFLALNNFFCDGSISSSDLERLHTILRAIKRIQGSAVRSRLPITFDIWHNMCKRIRKGLFSPFLNIMLEAAFTVAFFGLLRYGEFTCKSVFDPQIN